MKRMLRFRAVIKNGIPEAAARKIFQDMVKFAEYAFNKSHAAAYAVLAYETAWLKKRRTIQLNSWQHL